MNESLKAIKKIVNNIKIINDKTNRLYETCQNINDIGALRLLMLHHEVNLSLSYYNYCAYSYVDEILKFNDQANSFSEVWDVCEFDIHTPQYFIEDEDSAMSIRFSLPASNFFANMYNVNKAEFDEIVKNPTFFKYTENIQNKLDECKTIVNAKLQDMETIKGDDFDDEFINSYANVAILKAYKHNNINECELQMDEIREAIINIFHNDLEIYDTNNIGKLYYIGLQKLASLADMNKRVVEMNSERKLEKKNKKLG